MNILVVDGQGGGIGSRLISILLEGDPIGAPILAVGTNALATSAMLKAGAGAGATGENAVVYNAARAGIILGPIGILIANGMLGEITPAMAAAISGSSADKILIPSARCSVYVAGQENRPMEACLRDAADLARNRLNARRRNSGTPRD